MEEKVQKEDTQDARIHTEEMDSNLKEIIKLAKKQEKSNKLTQTEIDNIIKEANASLDFLKLLDEIQIADNGSRVIFTNQNEQLVYENGEFFTVNTKDSTTPRKKKKKQEARDLYLEYIIRYSLNPMLKQKGLKETVIDRNIKINENAIVDKELEKSERVSKVSKKAKAEKLEKGSKTKIESKNKADKKQKEIRNVEETNKNTESNSLEIDLKKRIKEKEDYIEEAKKRLSKKDNVKEKSKSPKIR